MLSVASKSFSRQRAYRQHRFARAGGYGRVGFGARALPRPGGEHGALARRGAHVHRSWHRLF
eukprot:9895135-Alexandrium_andersonii.AAC.1